MKTTSLVWMAGLLAACASAPAPAPPRTYTVKAIEDFEVTGSATNPAWAKAEWAGLNRRQADGLPYDARFKLLYSKKGIYTLMEGTDRKITSTMQEDFLNLWTEDVFEAFFWPDERHPIYFEYEISPKGKELPILVPNLGSRFMGWRPWHYEGDRRIRKGATVQVEGDRSKEAVSGWRAEFFIPYELMKPLQNMPPAPGTRWRANFYRMDYDDGKMTQWDWARVGPSFHEYEKYGTLVFD
jgi:hypothetical protein